MIYFEHQPSFSSQYYSDMCYIIVFVRWLLHIPVRGEDIPQWL